MTTWVLLRGLAREARHWGTFPAQLRRALPPDDVVVALDLPGNGTRWRERSPARLDQVVEHARRQLAGLPVQPPHVFVAVSLGAMVALPWAALEGREAAGCVLINSSFGGLSPFWRRLRPASYPTLLSLLVPGRDAAQREREILQLTSNRPVPEPLVRQWADHAGQYPLSRGNALRQLVAAARARAPVVPAALPALVLASRHDRLVSCACSEAIARRWSLPLHLHPEAGHDLPLDDGAWVVARILEWAAELPGLRSGAAKPGGHGPDMKVSRPCRRTGAFREEGGSMNAIKTGRRLIAEHPDSLDARIVSALVLALESEQPFHLGGLYQLDLKTFELALEILREWRLDRYYAGKAKLFDLSWQLQGMEREAGQP